MKIRGTGGQRLLEKLRRQKQRQKIIASSKDTCRKGNDFRQNITWKEYEDKKKTLCV